MKVSFGNQTYKNNNKQNYKRAAISGAATTAIFFAASTAASAVMRPEAMKQVVAEAGGKLKYAKTFALGLAIMSGLGAAFSTAYTAIISKIASNKNPENKN